MKLIYGIFKSASEANETINDLNDRGYDDRQIGVIAPAEAINQYAYHAESLASERIDAKVGGILSLVAGVVPTVVPAVGPIISAGSFFNTHQSDRDSNAGTASALGLLQQQLDSPNKAAGIAQALRRGSIILTVKPDLGDDNLITELFRINGAIQIKRAEQVNNHAVN